MTNEQMRQRIAELPEKLRTHVELMARTGSGLSLIQWDEISNDILRAASLLSASLPASEPDADAVERVARAIDRLEYLALARAQNATDRNDAKSAGSAARAALLAIIGGPDAE